MVKSSKPTAAFYGGSFDPPHLGHQHIVNLVLENLNIDKLLVVPAYLNPFKNATYASPTQRLVWCQSLFDTIDKVSVEAYEVKKGKSTTTFQSVKYFSNHYDVKYIVIGSDNLKSLTKWHQFEWLNRHITWIIVTRKGYELHTDYLENYKILRLDCDISSTQIRDDYLFDYIDDKIKKSVQNLLKGATPMEIQKRVNTIVEILDEKKADEIEVFNLDEADYIAKRVVIANSLNNKHTLALFEHLKTALKTTQDTLLASDISEEWIVADLGDILVHIMIPEYRQRYSLEQFLSELIANQKRDNAQE